MAGELARDCDDDDRPGLASGLERLPASVQPPGAALGLGLDRERLASASAFERDAPTGRRALMPGGLDQQPAYMAVACLGDRALATSLAAGVFTWGESEERSERLGTEPVPVSELDRQRERRQRRNAAQTDEPLDDVDVRWRGGKLCDRFVECVASALRVELRL